MLLTGVTGFIAHRIALDLLIGGHEVRGSLRDVARADAVRDALRPHLSDPSALDRLSFVELDLSRDAGWEDAARGTDAILHTASPFPLEQSPKDPETVIRPAVEGALRALRAAKAAGVERVILTSSSVAIMQAPQPEPDRPRDERDWTDPDAPGVNAYARSKTLAERAAWDEAERTGIALTTINPGFVLGPLLADEGGTSIAVIQRILDRKDPAVPDLTFDTVDVRDVSRAHLAALETPGTAGRRYVVSSGPLSFVRMAELAKEEAPDRRIVTRRAPTLLMRALALFDPAVRGVLPLLGKRLALSNLRARKELGITFIPAEDAARETIRSLLGKG